MKIILAFVIFLVTLCAVAQPVSKIEFQGIALESKYADLPGDKFAACTETQKNARSCFIDSKISGQPAFIELSYVGDVLADIEVYFPRQLHTVVSAAYFQKYGEPWHRDTDQYMWRFAYKDVTKQRSIFVFRDAELPTLYAEIAPKGLQWSRLSFSSMAPYADESQKQIDKVKRDL